jgi:hypothetical protein
MLIVFAPGMKVVEPANGTVVPPGNEGDTSAYVWFEVETGHPPLTKRECSLLTR